MPAGWSAAAAPPKKVLLNAQLDTNDADPSPPGDLSRLATRRDH